MSFSWVQCSLYIYIYIQCEYLSLLLLSGRTVWTKKVLFVEVVCSQLFGLDVSNGLVTNWYPTEGFNLHPAHEILSCKMLVQENLTVLKISVKLIQH